MQLGLHPELLWLWHRPVAAALTGPLAWILPYAMSVALKSKKKKKKERERGRERKKELQIRRSDCGGAG